MHTIGNDKWYQQTRGRAHSSLCLLGLLFLAAEITLYLLCTKPSLPLSTCRDGREHKPNTGKGVHIVYAAVFEALGLEEGETAGRSPVLYLFGKSTLPSSQGESLLSTSFGTSPAQSEPLPFWGGTVQNHSRN